MIGIALTKASHALAWKCCLRWPWRVFLILGFAGILPAAPSQAGATNYLVRGVVKGVKQDEHQLVIAHEDIPDFMDAMTMPFNVKDAAILTHVAIGEKITFQLHVTETESWVDHIEPSNVPQSAANRVTALSKSDSDPEVKTNPAAAGRSKNPLREYEFTNELGQPVSLSDFRGQAIALTFFFTRCPIPEFCPRLSRNFEEVQRTLSAMENAPTNWHLLSVTFDPAHDTPEVLKSYGKSYQYDPVHWSFLTGPKDKIAELARLCDVTFEPDNGFFNHNFRTLIIDASNHLRMVFPTSGNISESIVQELLRAAGETSRATGRAKSYVRSEPDKNPGGFDLNGKRFGNQAE
jgi:protein SCO1